MSVDAQKLVEIQPKEPKQRKPRAKGVPPPEPLKRPKLIKGSQEAKDYMAKLREKRKTKQLQKS